MGPPQSMLPLERSSHIALPSRSPPSSSSVAVASPLKKRGRRERRPVAQGEELPPFVPPVTVAPSPYPLFV
ncbi:hypothetical protein AHAS_Ahas15G0141300 [Arachis hypogaea]